MKDKHRATTTSASDEDEGLTHSLTLTATSHEDEESGGKRMLESVSAAQTLGSIFHSSSRESQVTMTSYTKGHSTRLLANSKALLLETRVSDSSSSASLFALPFPGQWLKSFSCRIHRPSNPCLCCIPDPEIAEERSMICLSSHRKWNCQPDFRADRIWSPGNGSQ